MNNILVSIKKFFTNKNVVTVLGVIAILVLLYFTYNATIEAQVKPTKVPIANQTIQPRTYITEEMVSTIEVPLSMINTKNVEMNKKNIIGKYSNINTLIPEGSMFYKNALINKEDIPDSAFTAIKKGHRPYSLKVTLDSTYGNSIFPGNKIDIYMKAKSDDKNSDNYGKIMVGRFLAKVEVLAVKDSMGRNVFENTDESRQPASILFGVPEDIFILLHKAEELRGFSVELFPVPYGGEPPKEGEVVTDRTELVNFIKDHSVELAPDDENENIED